MTFPLTRRQLFYSLTSGLAASLATTAKAICQSDRNALRLPDSAIVQRLAPPNPPSTRTDTNYQVLVIGAGAAGLAAAQTLQAAGKNVLVLEARDRIGGRVHTHYGLADHPIELGAEFVHGDRVITWEWLRQFGFDTVKVMEQADAAYLYANDQMLSSDRILTQPDLLTAVEFVHADDAELYQLVEQWQAAEQPDTNLVELLKASHTQLSPTAYRIVDAALSGDYAANLQQLGSYGLLEATYEGDGDHRYFRIRQGGSRFLEAVAARLNIQRSTPVERIAWNTDGVTVQTANKVTFTAEQVVITVPLSLLQAGAIAFTPNLPEVKRQAIQGIGMGQITKLILKFDRPFWSDQMETLTTTLGSQLWWRPGYRRSPEAAILTGYTGAADAQKLSTLGQAGAIAAGLRDLEQMFDRKLGDRLIDGVFVDWQTDPYARGAYSYLPVNATGLRAKLAEPVDHVLFFAGEATHVIRPATVHGAIESGIRAAQEILARAGGARLATYLSSPLAS